MDDLFLDTYYFFVLIETYWNVNTPEDIYYLIDNDVLIETYWNVNWEKLMWRQQS